MCLFACLSSCLSAALSFYRCFIDSLSLFLLQLHCTAVITAHHTNCTGRMRRRSVTTGWWAVEEGHWLAGAGAAEEGHSTDTNPCQISRNVTVVSKLNSDVIIQF